VSAWNDDARPRALPSWTSKTWLLVTVGIVPFWGSFIGGLWLLFRGGIFDG
jgi:hypothetical protein